MGESNSRQQQRETSLRTLLAFNNATDARQSGLSFICPTMIFSTNFFYGGKARLIGLRAPILDRAWFFAKRVFVNNTSNLALFT